MTDRLTLMIDRLSAQRDYLDYAVRSTLHIQGCVLDVGLGKGRTYDRLRTIAPTRDVHAFDMLIHCPLDVVPPPQFMWLGDFRHTLHRFARERGSCAAIVHADIGSDDRAADRILANAIAPLLHALTAPGAIVLSDRELSMEDCIREHPEQSPSPWPYYVYRKAR